MIGRLSGVIESTREEFLILDVGGVGFKVFCSAKTLASMPKIGERATILIETIVREESITLFGFSSEGEQMCFNTLCKVNGIGSKLALKIMDVLSVGDIVLAIANGDRDMLCRAPGVGTKMALRIIAELQNCSMVKNSSYFESIDSIVGKTPDSGGFDRSLWIDAIQALEGLGYQKNSISTIVVSIVREKPHLTLESVITESLKKINDF
ncbi:MAG: Holliday junction branch migration protein RuvA [Rickettsiales bacterium]|nr:Holliday junction branch migration protein RuvA [Rickettsiales bacterium]